LGCEVYLEKKCQRTFIKMKVKSLVGRERNYEVKTSKRNFKTPSLNAFSGKLLSRERGTFSGAFCKTVGTIE